MKNQKFTLVLAGVAEITPELADALYEAMNGNIEFSMRNGIAYLDVTRASPSLQQAITSAIRDVEMADVGVRVLRVESEAANTIARINAELLEATRG